MKFSDILKTIGLTNNNNGISGANNTSNINHHNNNSNLSYGGKFNQIPKYSSVDRIYYGGHHPYHSHHSQSYPIGNPYLNHNSHQMDMVVSPSIGNYYYPPYMYGNGHHHDGNGGTHGLKFSASSASAGQSHSGYGDSSGNGGGGSNSNHHPPSGAQVHHTADNQYYHRPQYHHHPEGSVHHSHHDHPGHHEQHGHIEHHHQGRSKQKEHMMAMNPTVMVMSAGVARLRPNKMTDYSRESSEKEQSKDDIVKATELPKDDFSEDDDDKNYDNLYRNVSLVSIKTKFPAAATDEFEFHTKINNKNKIYKDGETYYMRIN